MITHVLDTSAILAHYLNEPGADDVNAILAQGPEAAGSSLIGLVELRGRLATIPSSLVRQLVLPPKKQDGTPGLDQV